MILRELETQLSRLSQLSFNDVVYKALNETGYVVPPVVSRGGHHITKGGPESVAADEYYALRGPAGSSASCRPGVTIWSWASRRHLTFGPIPAFGQGRAEDLDRYMAEGRRQGRMQAEEALRENMSLLHRDYVGSSSIGVWSRREG